MRGLVTQHLMNKKSRSQAGHGILGDLHPHPPDKTLSHCQLPCRCRCCRLLPIGGIGRLCAISRWCSIGSLGGSNCGCGCIISSSAVSLDRLAIGLWCSRGSVACNKRALIKYMPLNLSCLNRYSSGTSFSRIFSFKFRKLEN